MALGRGERERAAIASQPLSRQRQPAPPPDGAVHDSERTTSEGEDSNTADEGPGEPDALNTGAAESGVAREEKILKQQGGSNGHVEAAGGVLKVHTHFPALPAPSFSSSYSRVGTACLKS